MKKEMNVELLRELLIYDAERGVFYWRVNKSTKAKAGDEAGCKGKDGYIRICICRHVYLAHRLAWMYVHGDWPSMYLDHVNRIPSDNRMSNLREVTLSQNQQNKLLQKNNKSGYKGVSWNRSMQRWVANIKVNRKKYYLGVFDSPEAASDRYIEAVAKMHSHAPVPSREEVSAC